MQDSTKATTAHLCNSHSRLARHKAPQVGVGHLDFALSVSRVPMPMKASQYADLFLLKRYKAYAMMQLASEAGLITLRQNFSPPSK